MLIINSLEKYQSEYIRSIKKPKLFWEGIAESFEWKNINRKVKYEVEKCVKNLMKFP